MACSGVLESLTEDPRVSLLHSTLEPFFAGKTLTLKCHAPVAVIALQRHLSAQQNTGSQQAPDSYNFDIIVTDGVCQTKCLLDQGLNHLVHKNVLRSGIDIHINHCSFIHNERRLGQSFVCINRIECGSPLRESNILLKINDLDSIPMLSKNGLGDISLQNDAPLQIGRKHYLALWNNEDPEGAVWLPNINPPDVVLDGERSFLLMSTEIHKSISRDSYNVYLRFLDSFQYSVPPGSGVVTWKRAATHPHHSEGHSQGQATVLWKIWTQD